MGGFVPTSFLRGNICFQLFQLPLIIILSVAWCPFYQLCVHKGVGLVNIQKLLNTLCFCVSQGAQDLGSRLWSFSGEKCAAYNIGLGLKDLLFIPAQVSHVVVDKSLTLCYLPMHRLRIIQVGKGSRDHQIMYIKWGCQKCLIQRLVEKLAAGHEMLGNHQQQKGAEMEYLIHPQASHYWKCSEGLEKK